MTAIVVAQSGAALSATAVKSTWVKDMNLAEQALQKQDWRTCERHYTEALKEARSPNGSSQRLASTLAALAVVESHLGKTLDAEALAGAAVALTDKEPNGPILAKNLRVLASVYLQERKFELCFSTLKRSLSILEKTESSLTAERIYVLRTLSDVCLQRKDIASAEQYAEQLVSELERLRTHKKRFQDDLRDARLLLATRLLQLARSYAEKSDFDQSTELLRRALLLKVEHLDIAGGLEEVAQYSRAMQPPKPATQGLEDKQLKLAETCRLEAYALRTRLEKALGEKRPWDASGLATLYMYQGRRAEAEKWVRVSESLACSLPDSSALAGVYFSLSLANEGLGNFAVAADEMTKSIRMMKAHREMYSESQISFAKEMLDKQLTKVGK